MERIRYLTMPECRQLCGKERSHSRTDCYSLKDMLTSLGPGWHLGTWIWGEFPMPEHGFLCLNGTESVVYVEHLLPSRGLEFCFDIR